MEDIIDLFSKHSADIDDKLGALHDWIEEVNNEIIQDEQMTKKTSALFRFTCILRELVLSHRWQDVVHVLGQIVMEASDAQDIIHHLGFEVFLQEPSLNYGLLKKFADHIKLLGKYDTRQILLDFFMYLLSQQHFENVVISKNCTKACRKSRVDKAETYLRDTYRAYEGLLYYIKWHQVKSRVESGGESEQTSSEAENMFGHVTEEKSLLADREQLRQYKDKACSCFEVCLQHAGVWDVFIAKQIEMLEYHNEISEARLVLKEYLEKQPDNPYILSVLYEFEKRNGDTELEESYYKNLEVLKSLCKKVPFGECVLELYTLLKETDDERELRLQLLFDLLDYPQWKDNVHTWQLLAEELGKIGENLDRDEKSTVLSALWSVRSDWWLPYHFTYNASEEGSLLCWKAITAVHLYGTDSDFVEKVRTNNRIDSHDRKELLLTTITKYSTSNMEEP